jgi:hypothetical protein
MSQLRKIQRRNRPKKQRAEPLRGLLHPDFTAIEDQLDRFYPDLRDYVVTDRQDVITVDSLRTETRMAHDLTTHQLVALGLGPPVLVVSNPDDEMQLLEERTKAILQRRVGP